MKNTLGDQELAVLGFILDQGPMSVREASERFGESSGLARTTVQTVMERLRKKGFLVRKEQEGVFLYEGAVERRTLLNDLIGEFVRTRLGGSLSPFVAYLTENRSLEKDEVRQLREMVDELEEKP